MEIFYFYLPDGIPAMLKIKASKENIAVAMYSLGKISETEFEYRELSNRIEKGKEGDRGWLKLGFWLLFLSFIIYFASRLFSTQDINTWLQTFSQIIFVLGAVSFLLYLSIKREYISFHEKINAQSGFAIVLTKQNRIQAKKLVEYISNRIYESNLNKES